MYYKLYASFYIGLQKEACSIHGHLVAQYTHWLVIYWMGRFSYLGTEQPAGDINISNWNA
jgi:hypothetical protein